MKIQFLTAPLRKDSCLAIAFSFTVAAALVAIPPGVTAQLAAPESGLINPRAIVFNSASGKVYAVDSSHNAVLVFDGADIVPHRVPVGEEPVSIAVNTSTGSAYVANAGAGTVSVLDGASDSVVATVPIGSHPYSIAVDSVTAKVFVTHTFGDQVSVLDGKTNLVTDLKTGSADLIAINSRTGTVYLLGYGGDVTVLDESSQKFTKRPVGRHAWGLMLNESSGAVYVTRIENSDLASFTGAAEPEILAAGAIPCAIAVNSNAHLLYVANYGENSISVVNAKARTAQATILVGDHPKAIAYDPVRNLVYVANTLGNSVTVIDAATNKALATLPAGSRPFALAVVPGSSRLYVANESVEQPATVVDIGNIKG